MPGHPDQEQSRGHAHEEGRGPAMEDRGFFMEMLGIFALDSLGEFPGLNNVKRAYGKIKERFELAKDLKDTARDLCSRAMDLETALGEIDVPICCRDTSINLCADLRRLIGELEDVIHTGKVTSVVKHNELEDGMNAKKTRFDQLSRRFTTLETRSQSQAVRDDISSLYGEVLGVRKVVEQVQKTQADQISVQNTFMTRTDERFCDINSRLEEQGSSQIFASLARMEEGIAGLGSALDK